MKLQDLKISTQLRIAQGVILALGLGFGLFAWQQTTRIWQEVETIYSHPLPVRAAIGGLEADVLTMRLEFRNLLLAKDDPERQVALQNSAACQANAARQFSILRECYLGPPADIDAAETAFARWTSAQDDTRAMAQAGKVTEAMSRVADAGDVAQRRVQLAAAIDRIETFASAKAAQLYQAATEQRGAMSRHLIVGGCVALLLALGVGGLLYTEVRTPLVALTATAKQFRKGRLDARSDYASANEFGTLAAAFNTMAEKIQVQIQINENAARFAETLMREDDIHVFCRNLLKGLLESTGSQVAAVYFQNEAQTAFVHFESIGLGAGARAAFSATDLEGEMGAVLATRQIQHLTGIPADTRFTFAAVSGDFTPREILTIPVVAGNAVVAVISLASIRAYDDAALRLVHKVWSVLSARVNGMLAFRKIHYFAEQLERQNQELEAQQRELGAQKNELTEQNAELEMQKRQLHEANRLKSAFLSNMSHELRTPLNSVIALSGVLHRRLADSIPTEEYTYLEVIQRNGKNLLALINNILDLSRIEAGREDLSSSRFSVRGWVGEIVEMLAPQALEKNLALSNLVPDDLPLLHSDPVKCRHILQNLVGNAMKFTESGSVEISACVAHDELLVSVRDTGIGIAARHLPHIFDEFRQADDSASRKFGGTGLGLAIASKYAQLLGGGITVESTPGQGSAFTLRLPLEAPWLADAPAAQSAPPVAERAPAAAPDGQGKRLLLVEDNEPAIIQLTDILRAQGYQVQVARDGGEALRQIGHSVPDAMILDLMMPGVDGFQVLKAIRSEPRTAEVPVLILTAKHVTREELSFLTGNHIHQLIQKGDINRDGLLDSVARMVAPSAAVPPPPSPLRRRPGRPGQAIVLVVEDNPDNLRTAIALLDGHYQVITAEHGQAAIEQARRHQPDLILTDLSMPVMDGFDALAAIRQDAALCDIPVIAVTASAMKGSREEILARGFDSYISKPIDHDLLLGTLRGFLE